MKAVKKPRFWIFACSVVAIIGLGVTYIALLTWSPLCCRYEDVDINTGRIRYSRYFLYCKTAEQVEDSILTSVLPPECLRGMQPDWRRVNTFSPGLRHSPHHAYHGAISQIRSIKIAWDVAQFSDEAKRQVAETLLKIWQSGGNYRGAEGYVRNVCDIALQAAESESIVSNTDLPTQKNE